VRKAGLTAHAIQLIIDARRQAANIAPFTPHDLRRTFAGDLLHANVDIVTVQKLLGHSNPATTAGYDRRGVRARQEAVKHIHVPYVGRAAKPAATSR
jgi:integrase